MSKIFFKLKSYLLLLIKGRTAYAKYLGVTFGENCRLYTLNWGTEPFLINIGNNVTITAGVTFITHDGSGWLFRDNNGRRYIYQKICIGNNVFIGLNSIIMPGVVIEDRVIVAAGSIVTKSVPSGSIVAGNPAKIIGRYCDLESRMISSYISDKDLDFSLSYKQRINKVLTNTTKPYLK